MIYPMSQQWAIKTFIMIMDSLINDYRKPKFADEKAIKKVMLRISGVYGSKSPTTGRTSLQ